MKKKTETADEPKQPEKTEDTNTTGAETGKTAKKSGTKKTDYAKRAAEKFNPDVLNIDTPTTDFADLETFVPIINDTGATDETPEETPKPKRRGRGRPKGSKNKTTAQKTAAPTAAEQNTDGIDSAMIAALIPTFGNLLIMVTAKTGLISSTELSKDESKILSETFTAAYPVVSVSPKFVFLVTILTILVSRAKI